MIASAARPIGRRGDNREVAEVVRSLVLGELLAPSRAIYVVTPWVADTVVLDNRTHAFSSLDPGWGATRVRLSQVLGRLAELGSRVTVATCPHARNEVFRERLREAVAPGVDPPYLAEATDLGDCGILGESFFLYGVVNLTDAGMTAGEDGLVLHTDPVLIGKTQQDFSVRWKGEGW